MDMNAGLTKISIATDSTHTHLPVNSFTPTPTPIENRLVKILNVRTLGSEVVDYLKPSVESLSGLSPSDYHSQLGTLIIYLQKMHSAEKRGPVAKIYLEAIQLLQAETARNDLLDEFRVMLLQG